MAPRLAELCELLVEEKFGGIAANVFSALARHGRLVLPQIQQYTATPIRHLRSTILTLTTHNVLLWHQEDDNDSAYFQVDWHTAYVLVRENKTIRLVESRYGKAACQLLRSILQRGSVKVGDLEGEQYFDMASPRDSGIGMLDDQASEDGMANDSVDAHGGDEQITTLASFHNTLRSLLVDGFLSKATPRDHIPVAELEEQLRVEVITADPRAFKDGKTTGPKTAVQFKQASNTLKRRWQDEAEYSAQRDVASHGSIKRGKSSASGSNKRRKVNDNLTDGFHDLHDENEDTVDMLSAESSLRKLPSDLWLRVNYNKCMIALRTERLEQLADKHLGPMSAAVYGALLRAAEGRSRSVRSQLRVKAGFSIDDEGEATDNAELSVTDTEILDRLQNDLDLASTMKDSSGALQSKSSNGEVKNNKKRRLVPDDDEDVAALGIKKEVESDDEDGEPIVNGIESTAHRQKRLNLVGMHLELLSESPQNFLRRNAENRTSVVNFDVLSNKLLDAELDSMILARSGPVGVRVVRILREKGKLLDTQIAGMCLKRLKDLRAILTNLQALGFIDVQELPKDNSRQPSRTVYLWSFNKHEVRQMFLQQTYQGLSRTLLRTDVEKQRSKDIIEKAESVDWDMKRLNKPERDLLAHWQATEEALTSAVDRLDDVVMILRDMDEADTSLLT